MPTVMHMHWPEITEDLYNEARRAVDWEGNPPDGAKFHVSWMSEDGFHVLDLWDSPEDFNTFATERLMPGIAHLGLQTQPRVELTDSIRVFVPNLEGATA